MAKYTTTIKNYLTSKLMIDNPNEDVDSWGYAKIIEQGMKYVFDFDYPIFDEAYRTVLQTKILKNYYMREIAHETFGLFKMRLDNQLNISMEYFNQLYESAKIQIEPLSDYKINDTMNKSKKEDTTLTEKTDNNVDETISNNAEDTSNGKSIFYKYPQTAISGNTDYATDMTETNESSTLKNNQTRNTENNTTKENKKSLTNTDDYIRTIIGNKLPQSDLLEKYRKTFINIDEQIINSLDNLFFMLW